jgi:hypothetical protein
LGGLHVRLCGQVRQLEYGRGTVFGAGVRALGVLLVHAHKESLRPLQENIPSSAVDGQRLSFVKLRLGRIEKFG